MFDACVCFGKAGVAILRMGWLQFILSCSTAPLRACVQARLMAQAYDISKSSRP